MPQTYTVTAPNGKTLDVTGDHLPTESELHDIFAKAGVDTKTPATAPTMGEAERMLTRRGLGSAVSEGPDAPPSGAIEALGPLAHPQTFTDFARLLTLPVDTVRRAYAAALTMAAARPAAAAAVNAVKSAPGAAVRGAVNGTAAVGDVVSPDVIGMVSPRAGKVVQVAQKIRDARAAAAPAVTEVAPVAEVAPAAPVTSPVTAAPAAVVDEFTAARTAKAAAPTNTLPDQKALNETALAARRLAYQKSQQAAGAAAEPIVPASGKMRFTAAEMKLFAAFRSKGLSLADAQTAVQDAKALAAKLGGASDAEMKAAVAHRAATGQW